MAGEDDRQDERRRPRGRNNGTTLDPEQRDVGGDAEERLHGLIGDSPEYDDIGPGAREPQGGGHVTGDMEWANSDADDPDAGSGRTDADDGGYLPGEGTGRPFR